MEKSAVRKDNRIYKYFRGLKSEIKKIVWPTWKQVLHNTMIVLVFVIIMGALIAGLDWLFNTGIINWFIK